MPPAYLAYGSRPDTSAFERNISALIRELAGKPCLKADVIPWSSPVPAFGDPERAWVATVGINPSNREFVDISGVELSEKERRFHTLRSLGLRSWGEASEAHVSRIAESCRRYFMTNPYDGWFKALDKIIEGTGASYYQGFGSACHLDLIPFATAKKWTALSSSERNTLLEVSRETLPELLRASRIRLLVLNGATVVKETCHALKMELSSRLMPEWTLRREGSDGVPGVSYYGQIDSVSGTSLGRKVTVLGYNHNIQSSFGVTSMVKHRISRWIMECSQGLA